MHVYPPDGPPPAVAMRTTGARPRMTPGRTALPEHSARAMGGPTLIAAQKLAYFLQVAGEPLRLKLVGHRYGPCADGPRHVLRQLVG